MRHNKRNNGKVFADKRIRTFSFDGLNRNRNSKEKSNTQMDKKEHKNNEIYNEK